MAQNANERFQVIAGPGAGLRCFSSSTQPKSFAVGAITLAPLTPVAFNTSTNLWVPYASGVANGTGTIKGFVWPDQVVLNAVDEVTGQVCLGGRVHIDDIPIIAGYTLAQLKVSLVAGVRELGFIIEGMVGFR